MRVESSGQMICAKRSGSKGERLLVTGDSRITSASCLLWIRVVTGQPTGPLLVGPAHGHRQSGRASKTRVWRTVRGLDVCSAVRLGWSSSVRKSSTKPSRLRSTSSRGVQSPNECPYMELSIHRRWNPSQLVLIFASPVFRLRWRLAKGSTCSCWFSWCSVCLGMACMRLVRGIYRGARSVLAVPSGVQLITRAVMVF